MEDQLTTQITFAEYRNAFVAEIWQGNIHIGEVYIDRNGKTKIDLFYINKDSLSFNLEEFIRAIQEANKKLNLQQ